VFEFVLNWIGNSAPCWTAIVISDHLFTILNLYLHLPSHFVSYHFIFNNDIQILWGMLGESAYRSVLLKVNIISGIPPAISYWNESTSVEYHQLYLFNLLLHFCKQQSHDLHPPRISIIHSLLNVLWYIYNDLRLCIPTDILATSDCHSWSNHVFRILHSYCYLYFSQQRLKLCFTFNLTIFG